MPEPDLAADDRPSAAAEPSPMRILSGIQASGALHVGNYLGAIKRFVALQTRAESFVFVADLHALTAWQDPATLADQTREIAAAYLACGLDPLRTTIFAQSSVHAHAELAWIFNCVARVGWLDRMTQFKDKTGRDKEGASVGLYTYPVLQAADILLYRPTHVPVGEDQKQHVELTRDIAQKFNVDFGAPAGKPDFFALPQPLIEGPAARVMSLRDGSAKMSKSDASDASRINLLDDADAIAGKVKRAKSDADLLPERVEDLAGRPEASNLIGLYAGLADISKAEALARFAGQGFGRLKPALAGLAVERLAPIGAEMRRLMADPGEIDRVLRDGSARAAAMAEPVLADVRRLVGFWR